MNECACLIRGGPVVNGLLRFHSCLQTLQLSLCLAREAKSFFLACGCHAVSILLTGGCQ